MYEYQTLDTDPNTLSVEKIRQTLTQDFGWVSARKINEQDGIKSIDPRITHACDHVCPHCWANVYGKNMTVETFSEMLDLAKQAGIESCLLYTSPSPRDRTRSRMPSSA